MAKKYKFAALFFIPLLLAAAVVWIISSGKDNASKESHIEIEKIKRADGLDEQVQVYLELIERVGPIRAQEALYASGLPFNGQTHLLNHAVGDYVYEQYGEDGLVYCKDYFLSSCYHGFLIRVIGDGGFEAVNESVRSCRKEGWPVYVQCAHAMGHGFLAHTGYPKLTEALAMCDKVKHDVSDFPEFNCHDGVFMENIWGAHHGEGPSPDRWIDESDLHYPCSDPRIDRKHLKGCWSNQPSLLYEITDGDIEKIGHECGEVADLLLRETCYDGLARQIHPVADGDIDKIFAMCGFLSDERIAGCLTVIAQADFSVGGREVPFGICDRMEREGSTGADECYRELIGMIKAYSQTKKERTEWCESISNERQRSECNS